MNSLSHSIHDAARKGYGSAADLYKQARPAYPTAAVDWVLARLRGSDVVVEVGAGTGKFTSQLIARGFQVTAVEPVAAMREHLRRLSEDIRIVDATAEELPFKSDSVSRLVASQSLHWANVDDAFNEFDRVLTSEGLIALIWNFRDVSVPWQADLDALLADVRGDAPHSRDGRWERALETSAFGIQERERWRWATESDLNGVLARVHSVSYVAALDDETRAEIDRRVLDILRQHNLGDTAIAFPYVTEAYSLKRRERY